LRRGLEAEAVAASTSMEGVPVTVEEVHHILAGDRPARTREEDAALVRGYRDAMSFVLRRADDRAFKWDRELLIGLHDRILAGNWGAGAGRFRTGPHISSRTAPASSCFSHRLPRTCLNSSTTPARSSRRGLSMPPLALRGFTR